MADHQEFVDLAIELITEEGRLITLKKLDAGPVDSDKPWLGAGEQSFSDTVTNVPAVFVPASGKELGSHFVSDDLLRTVDQLVLVAPVQEGLDQYQILIDTDGTEWKVGFGQVLKPADKTILYLFGVT